MYDIYQKLLDEHKLKNSDIAKATGISNMTLSAWKRGVSTPKQDKLKKIADYFGVTIDYLMTGEDVTPSEPQLTPKDERDIAKDMENIIQKLRNNESGPASYDGEPISEGDIDLLAGQIELMIRRLKVINKEKYNPNKKFRINIECRSII